MYYQPGTSLLILRSFNVAYKHGYENTYFLKSQQIKALKHFLSKPASLYITLIFKVDKTVSFLQVGYKY